MKFTPLAVISLLALFLSGGALNAENGTNLLPGLTYHPGPEKLDGKLVFLIRHDCRVQTNSPNAASIYEFDLSQNQQKKLTDCPFGQFGAAEKGSTFCVVFVNGKWDIGKDTNVFAYSAALGGGRVTNVES